MQLFTCETGTDAPSTEPASDRPTLRGTRRTGPGGKLARGKKDDRSNSPGAHAELEALWREFRRTRDKAIRDRLILTYAPLVKFVAARVWSGLPAHVDENDLASHGLLGLIGAIERYDPDRNVKFETYAITRIKGAIIDQLRAMDWVPRSVRARARAIEQATAVLEAQLHRTPTVTEIAKRIGITEDELADSLTDIARSSIATLDGVWTISSRGDGAALTDTIVDTEAPEPEARVTEAERRETLAAWVAALPDREKIVITLHYYEELTLREIGDVLGVTESRVSQLHTKAILGLRSRLPGAKALLLAA